MNIPAWIAAFRLRTLPLSISGILAGSGLAKMLLVASENEIQESRFWTIFTFSILTTVLFQLVSNLANDFGDGVKGTDNQDRLGPERAVQSGAISPKQMQFAVILFSILSLLSAGALIYFSKDNLTPKLLYFYVGLAVLCVVAAITYTVGKSAYGYRGLGDIMVFLFFGLVSVLGVFSLYGFEFEWLPVLPAYSIGVWSMAVLNLNNMRDMENDRASGKNTLVVKLGIKSARFYHFFLVSSGIVIWLIFCLLLGKLTGSFLFFLPLFPVGILLLHLLKVKQISDHKEFDKELKPVALATFFASLLFFLLAIFIL